MDATHHYKASLFPMKDNKAFTDANLAGTIVSTIADLQRWGGGGGGGGHARRATKEAHQQGGRLSKVNSQLSKDKEAQALLRSGCPLLSSTRPNVPALLRGDHLAQP